jgi:hypothetical protein
LDLIVRMSIGNSVYRTQTWQFRVIFLWHDTNSDLSIDVDIVVDDAVDRTRVTSIPIEEPSVATR